MFRGKSLQEIQEITFKIGMLGQYGLEINDLKETHALRAARWGGPSRRCSLSASCKPGLQRIGPGVDIGVKLGEVWGMAVAEIRIIMVAFRQSFNTSTLREIIFKGERASRSD
ncbi:MAG TPA: hypothetical protein PLY52_08040 [Methanothrix sp.]|uniref:hypothetical protein n=2 Tax=Methanothrix sp. TaxID=90426 RepID=UPI002BF97E31|nr:hypothetical protein [Methanothrix sp.]MDI9417875.1 hypothetical protein [Euryarchaeota archaeon]HON36240.1 hypothetical protein [Methanothrix sp.]HRU74920.1 hypothetical protein [Methanothrix sp.]